MDATVKTYTEKSNAVRALRKAEGKDADVTRVQCNADGMYYIAPAAPVKKAPAAKPAWPFGEGATAAPAKKAASEKAAPAAKPAPARTAAPREERKLRVSPDAGARRGDFGRMVAAVELGHNTTPALIAHLADVDAGYISRSVSWGIKHGVFEVVQEGGGA